MLSFEEHRLVFPGNPKVVPACSRENLQLTLVNISCTPHASKTEKILAETKRNDPERDIETDGGRWDPPVTLGVGGHLRGRDEEGWNGEGLSLLQRAERVDPIEQRWARRHCQHR